LTPAPEKYPFYCELKFIGSIDEGADLAARVQSISEFVAEVTTQGLPSSVTLLLPAVGENPLPLIFKYCPATLPLAGLTTVTVGNAVNSKY